MINSCWYNLIQDPSDPTIGFLLDGMDRLCCLVRKYIAGLNFKTSFICLLFFCKCKAFYSPDRIFLALVHEIYFKPILCSHKRLCIVISVFMCWQNPLLAWHSWDGGSWLGSKLKNTVSSDRSAPWEHTETPGWKYFSHYVRPICKSIPLYQQSWWLRKASWDL